MQRKKLLSQDSLLIGIDFQEIDYDHNLEDPQASESQMIYQAIGNQVERIWSDYSFIGPRAKLLTATEIRAFLRNFLKDQNFNETDLDIVLQNMNLSDGGTIDRYEMAVFLLKVAEHEELVVPEVLKQHLKRVRSI